MNTCYRDSRYVKWDPNIGGVDPSHCFLSKSTGTSSTRTFWQKPVKRGKTYPHFHDRYVATGKYIFCESLFISNSYIIYHCDSNVSNPRIYFIFQLYIFYLILINWIDWYDSSKDLLYIFWTSFLSDHENRVNAISVLKSLKNDGILHVRFPSMCQRKNFSIRSVDFFIG